MNIITKDGLSYQWTKIKALLAAKQAALVSGTSIKTINSTTLLGSGNIAINNPAAVPARVVAVSGASPACNFASAEVYRWSGTGVVTFNISGVPAGVRVQISARFSGAGTPAFSGTTISWGPAGAPTAQSAAADLVISLFNNGSYVEGRWS